jgi:tRNA G46 methylase TrmB
MTSQEDDLTRSDKYWEEDAGTFSEIYTTRKALLVPNRLFLRRRFSIVQNFLKREANSVVLDIGCGSGEFTEILTMYV